MISQTLEYALRAVVILAQTPDVALTATDLSEKTQASSMYLSKVMSFLVRDGLVLSQRGPGGGFKLSRSPQEVSLLDVMQAVEPFQRIHTCPLNLASHQGTLCPLHRHLDNTMAQIEENFRNTSIADLLGKSNVVVPLCETGAQDRK